MKQKFTFVVLALGVLGLLSAQGVKAEPVTIKLSCGQTVRTDPNNDIDKADPEIDPENFQILIDEFEHIFCGREDVGGKWPPKDSNGTYKTQVSFKSQSSSEIKGLPELYSYKLGK